MTERFEVSYGNEWMPGRAGWMCEGWMGETVEEAIAEYLLRNGRDPNDYSRSQIVDVTPQACRDLPGYVPFQATRVYG